MDAMTEIKSLVACEDRRAGTEGERRAAEHLAARLRSLGRDAELEPAVVRPDYPLTYVLHILLALAGGAVAMRWPKLGAAALLVAIGSAVGDSYGRFHLLRRLTRSAVTHNVLSREQAEKPGTLVILAHYDAAKTGWLFDPKALQRRVRLSRRIGIDVGLFEPFVWSLQGLLGIVWVPETEFRYSRLGLISTAGRSDRNRATASPAAAWNWTSAEGLGGD